jgi:MFS superfamily sulfate permease-like transporter
MTAFLEGSLQPPGTQTTSPFANGSRWRIRKDGSIETRALVARMPTPGLMTVKSPGSLHHDNAELFMNDILSLIQDTPYVLRWLVLQCESVGEIDYVGAKIILELSGWLQLQRIELVFTRLSKRAKSILANSGTLTAVGSERIFASLGMAIAAYHHTSKGSSG